MSAAPDDPTPSDMDLGTLVRYIADRHHAGARSEAQRIRESLDQLVADGQCHPALRAIRHAFGELAVALDAHMLKEESLLFSCIRDMAALAPGDANPAGGPFGTIRNPIRVMEADHAAVSALSDRLRSLTREFATSSGADRRYGRTLGALRRFDRELRRHLRLEGTVLFPRAVEMEQTLA